ncbi:MAG: Holliday junction resolvase RuvX [Clostridia bacterium]|nr:Holliday junction resolvase RuvX [Clostridia bacterium]
MALDLGERRIGIALSDLMGIIASGLETYERKSINQDCEYISKLITKYGVKEVVVGLPKNMDGTSGERVDKTYAFCEVLKTYTNAKIVFYDERLTTVAAEKLLISADVSRQKRKTVIDKLAATIILQDYLNFNQRGK